MANDPNEKAVDRNIEVVHRLRANANEKRSLDEKFVDHVARFLGSTTSVYVHILAYVVLWARDVPLGTMSFAASLEAIFLSLFVLINQRRMNSVERKNSDLHLQMSMLAEHEITRLAQITDLVAKHLGVNLSSVKGLEEVKKDIHPNEILERISNQEKDLGPNFSSKD